MLFIRTFLFELYPISSNQMEGNLITGDRVLIDKTAYGIRFPSNVLLLKIPYIRLGERDVNLYDIIVFNNPFPSKDPLDKKELLISRCVALPGDTIQIIDGEFSINNKLYPHSINTIDTYSFVKENKDIISNIIQDLDIDAKYETLDSNRVVLTLSKLEAYSINEILPDSLSLVRLEKDTINSVKFVIPHKGRSIPLNKLNITLYKDIIETETEGNLTISGENKCKIRGKEQDTYTFTDNYYWVVSDNSQEPTDSRTIGFIPSKNILGKASVVGYSSSNYNIRWDRFFSSIK